MLKYNPLHLMLILILLFAVEMAFAQWSEPVNISNTPYSSGWQDMAIDHEGAIHVVWSDASRLHEPGSDPVRADILYTFYNGISWAEPVQLSSYDTTYSLDPRIAVDSNNRPHVVWNHRCIFPDADAYYTTLTDSGWLEPFNLTPHQSTSYDPDIVIDSNDRIHVVWCDFLGGYGYGDIFYRYCDNGEWSDLENVSNSPLSQGFPRIEVDSEDHLHLAWMQFADVGIDCEVFYSEYDGNSWSPMLNISNIDSLSSALPYIAVDADNRPHVVWSQWLGWPVTEIFYTYRDHDGWTVPENITNLGLRTAIFPQLAISNQNIKCLLFSSASQFGDSYVNYSFFMNSQWTYPDTVWNGHPSSWLSCAIDNNDIIHACISTALNGSNIGYVYNDQYTNVDEAVELIPASYINLYNYPNPFNQSTIITYNLPRKSSVNLAVYDICGRIVDVLTDNVLPAGEHMIRWNATDRHGKEVSAGVYFVRLYVNGESTVYKMILIK